MRFVHSKALPITRLNGEKVHALYGCNDSTVMLLSPPAYMAFQKYKKYPDTLTDDDKQFLNYCLDQAENLKK